MAQWVKLNITKPYDLSSILGYYMAEDNQLPLIYTNVLWCVNA